MRRLRVGFQLAVLVAALVAGLRYALGWSRTGIEGYCPFGGLESALSLLTEQRFTCAAGERNLALFLALVALAVVSRKSFCGWVCPVGALSEWLARLAARLATLRGRREGDGGRYLPGPPPRWDRALRWLRLPVLAAILSLTYLTGELIFRGYDPYYILFSFHGHDVKIWSYGILGVVLAGVVLVPMAWCRYLCPLGVSLWPFARLGRLRLAREEEACTGCGACDRVCPQAIPVSGVAEVRSGECTLCLECSEDCPSQALTLVLR